MTAPQVCPVCERLVAVLADGSLRSHAVDVDTPWRKCHNSRSTS